MLLYAASHYPPPRPGTESVRVEINLDVDHVDRSGLIPQWPYSVEINFSDGSCNARGGSVEAVDQCQAITRAQAKAIGLLSDLLAEYVTKVKP